MKLSSCQNSMVITVPRACFEYNGSKVLHLNLRILANSMHVQFKKGVDIVVISPSFDFMESFSQLFLAKLVKNGKKGKKSGFISVEIIKTKPKQSFL